MNHALVPSVLRCSAAVSLFVSGALAQSNPAHSCTFFGGSSSDESIEAVAVASNGDLIVAGYTKSADLPGTAGGFDSTYSANRDAFVARLTGDGTQVLAATYLGSVLIDEASFVQEAGNGSIWVGGTTQSPAFPTTLDGFATHAGQQDAFVVRLSSDLSTLEYGTTLGGSQRNFGDAFAIDDANGRIYIAGLSTLDPVFPITPTAFQATIPGGASFFLSVLDISVPGSTTLAYSTFLGGSGFEDRVGDLTHEGAGIVTLSGTTFSADFPTTTGALQPSGTGSSNEDAVVTRINTQLPGTAGLLFGTYITGSGNESEIRHDTDASGDIYMLVQTNSPTMLTSVPSLISSSGPNSDAYYLHINPQLANSASLVYASWIVTVGGDLVADIAHVNGKVAMFIRTTQFGQLVTPGAFMGGSHGGDHGYVIELDVSQPVPTLSYATHYAGCATTPQQLQARAMHYDGNEVVLAGIAEGAPITAGAFQATTTNRSGFVGRLELLPWPAPITFGTSCPGSTATPQLAALTPARLCQSFDLEASALLPNSFVLFAAGLSRTFYQGVPLPASLAPLGAPGCMVTVALDFTELRATAATGSASWSIPMPSAPTFLGIEVSVQALALDLTANALGLTTTNGVASEVRW